jgi:hypothetical protein
MRKSSFCSGGDCVQVGAALDGVIVCDTKQPGVQLHYTAGVWAAFLDEVKAGQHECAPGDEMNLAASGATLTFTAGEWAAFVAGVKVGEFDPLSKALA